MTTAAMPTMGNHLIPSISSKERERFFGAGVATLENMGPPPGSGAFGGTGCGAAMPGAGSGGTVCAALGGAGAGALTGAGATGTGFMGADGATGGGAMTGGAGFSVAEEGAGFGAVKGA
jgi:hypothetical protein